MKNIIISISLITICIYLESCSKEALPINQFGPNQQDTNKLDTNNYDPYSIFSIHKDVLKPTCANSGCHDGNFEPDFRTVESSYFGLINVTPIKSNVSGGFPFRVVPGDASKSMLLQRMTIDLNGNSGIMPLALEPKSTYNQHKSEYLQRITKWINDGAKDLAGNLPTAPNFPPNIQGVVFIQGNNILARPGLYEAANATAGINTTVYFSLSDDKIDQSQLKNCTINVSANPDSFNVVNEKSLNAGPEKFMNDLNGKLVKYWYNYELQTSATISLDVLWIRITVTDDVQTVQLPNENSMFPIKKYFAIRFK